MGNLWLTNEVVNKKEDFFFGDGFSSLSQSVGLPYSVLTFQKLILNGNFRVQDVICGPGLRKRSAEVLKVK